MNDDKWQTWASRPWTNREAELAQSVAGDVVVALRRIQLEHERGASPFDIGAVVEGIVSGIASWYLCSAPTADDVATQSLCQYLHEKLTLGLLAQNAWQARDSRPVD